MTTVASNAITLDKTQIHTKNFRSLSQSAWYNGKVSSLHKHLIAVAIAQATNCKHCLLHHAKSAVQDGATFDQIAEISYLTGVFNIAGNRLLNLTDDFKLVDNIGGIISELASGNVNEYINQQLEPNFLAKEVKILALIGIAKLRGNVLLVEHLVKLAKNNDIDDDLLVEALLVVDVLSTGIVYSNNQDIYNFLNK